MRELMIQRIEDMKAKRVFSLNTYLLTDKRYKESSLYLGNDDWKNKSDAELLEFFEQIVAFSYRMR